MNDCPAGDLPGPKLVILLSHIFCNYQCQFCSQRLCDQHGRTPWSMETITDTCADLWETAELVNLGSTGEIGLWPHFDRALDYFSSRNIKTCFTTNGRYVNAEKLRTQKIDSILVSLHTTDEPTYDLLTGTTGNLPIVMDNIRILSRRPRDYALRVSVVLTELNASQAPNTARFCLECQVDDLKLTPLVEPDAAGLKEYPPGLVMLENDRNREALCVAKDLMRDSEGESHCMVSLTPDERLSMMTDQMKGCTAPYEQTVINYDGSVLPCCFMYVNSMGNIFETPWRDIWNGEGYCRFRESLRAGSNQNCVNYCRNWG